MAARRPGGDYVVLFAGTASAAAARAAIAQAGGTIESSNDKVGFAVVARVGCGGVATAISRFRPPSAGSARKRIMASPLRWPSAKNKAVERLTAERAAEGRE